MGVLSDWQIERDVRITPFSPARKRPNIVSYGVSSYGYDFRLGYTFDLFQPYPPGGAAHVIDPKAFDHRMLKRVDLTQDTAHSPTGVAGHDHYFCEKCHKTLLTGKDLIDPPCPKGKPDHLLIPPHSFVLAETLEKVWFPRDVLVLVVGKSTYARCGLIVNVTPGEPEWEGVWTVELSNTTDLPIKIYPGEGIMQGVFLRADSRYELALAALADHLAFDPDPADPRKVVEDAKEAARRLRELCLREGETFKEGTCRKSYADKKGKYQNQSGLTAPTVDKEPTGPVQYHPADADGSNTQERLNFPHPVRKKPAGWAEVANGLGRVTCLTCGFQSTEPRNHSRDGRLVCKNTVGPGMVWLDPTSAYDDKSPGPVEPPPPPPADPNVPPADADKGKPWPSPDGSVWRWSETLSSWKQVTFPTAYDPRGGK